MIVNSVPVSNPQPSPILTEIQRQIIGENIQDIGDITTSALRKALQEPLVDNGANGSKQHGTKGSLIDLKI